MHILVVDDNLDDRLLAVHELEREFPGLQINEVVDAPSFEQALDVGQFDLVITDYQLRWSNGLEILRAVKQRYTNRPVIMFTDTGNQEIAVEAMKAGLDDYILKSPKHFIRLSAAVRAALERTQERQRTALLEVRLQFLLNQLDVGVFRATPNERVIEGNSAFLRLLGFSSLEEVQSSSWNVPLSRVGELTSQPRRERELELRQANGSSIWVLLTETLTTVNGETVIDGLIEDITGRKRSETALKRYAQRLRTLQELDRSILQARSLEAIAQVALRSIASLVSCQLLDITVFDLEAAQAKVLAAQSNTDVGIEASFSVGQCFSFEEFGGITELQQNQALLIEDLSQDQRGYPLLQQLLTQGLRFILRVPVIAQGHLIGSLNLGALQPHALAPEDLEIAHEVANQLAVAIEQTRLREELQHYTEQLEHLVNSRTQQLQVANHDLEAFTYSISHDLREPLRALQGYAQILLEDHAEQLNSTGQTFANRILANAELMDTLLRDLLIYSRLSRVDLSLQPVNLNLAVNEAMTQLELQLQQQQAQVVVESSLLEGIGHFTTVVQVVTNLLANAIKFVEVGVQPQVHIWTERRDGWVRLWLADNGIGIAPEHWERIFRVFERLHGAETYSGTGVGLAIVRKGMERMGGRVGLESEAGRGSHFWIELPALSDRE